jgi:hypothetical protein
VLLDALTAIGPHRAAVVVVGAQAVYLRVGDADLAVAPYTTDADLAVDPSLLAEVPPLEKALAKAGFFPKAMDSVGIWVTHRPTTASPETEVAVDLLVPASVSPGKGRRAARLKGHDANAARIVNGLEGALVDSEIMTISSFEESDSRLIDVRVAGPGALLVAKLHKIDERKGTSRQSAKDALDVLRLLRGVTTEDLVKRMLMLSGDERSGAAYANGLILLRSLFASRTAAGTEMAVLATDGLMNADEVARSCEILALDLLTAIGA